MHEEQKTMKYRLWSVILGLGLILTVQIAWTQTRRMPQIVMDPRKRDQAGSEQSHRSIDGLDAAGYHVTVNGVRSDSFVAGDKSFWKPVQLHYRRTDRAAECARLL